MKDILVFRKSFHILVCQRDFVTELVNLECPQAIKEQVLSMIQSWSQAFSSDPELSGVVEVYNDLKMKGTVFPEPSTQDQILVTHSPSHSQVSAQVLPSLVMFCFSQVLPTLSTTLVLFLCMVLFLMYVTLFTTKWIFIVCMKTPQKHFLYL